MCYYLKQKKKAKELKEQFGVAFKEEENYTPQEELSGFIHPSTPIITNLKPLDIQLYSWGLLPSWTGDITFRKNTLNAKLETLNEKPSFQNCIQNRCLILTDGFYEWQWLNKTGTKKQKYSITHPDNKTFTLAGLWSNWHNRQTGEVINTYTIITVPANEQMSIIHNSKKRMPFILTSSQTGGWLNGQIIEPNVTIPLVAEPCVTRGVIQQSMF